MSIVRAITTTSGFGGDWTFGAGRNNYVSGLQEVVQDIYTRLCCQLGDCFFDQGTGIDWFNLLGSTNNELRIKLAISATILNTPFVNSLLQLSVSVGNSRNLNISYSATTTYGPVSDTVQVVI